jgi:hypothetical protein
MLRDALLRHMLALIGASAAMALHIYLSFDNQGLFALARIGNALGHGLLFGHVVALMVTGLLVGVPRIKQPVLRWSIGCIWGIGLGTLAWWVHHGLLLLNPSPDWLVLLIGGVALSAGFILGAYIRMPFVLRVLLTAGAIFLAIFVTYEQFLDTLAAPAPATALLYFRPEYPIMLWVIGPIFALSIALMGWFGWRRPSQ